MDPITNLHPYTTEATQKERATGFQKFGQNLKNWGNKLKQTFSGGPKTDPTSTQAFEKQNLEAKASGTTPRARHAGDSIISDLHQQPPGEGGVRQNMDEAFTGIEGRGTEGELFKGKTTGTTGLAEAGEGERGVLGEGLFKRKTTGTVGPSETEKVLNEREV
ncbi:hypothetical protein HDV05_008760 [Chytridiales sp. JEL 0842]|nr:hypothetical protein HDV05_008760 [Chytridiales sp. JEL 0842]